MFVPKAFSYDAMALSSGGINQTPRPVRQPHSQSLVTGRRGPWIWRYRCPLHRSGDRNTRPRRDRSSYATPTLADFENKPGKQPEGCLRAEKRGSSRESAASPARLPGGCSAPHPGPGSFWVEVRDPKSSKIRASMCDRVRVGWAAYAGLGQISPPVPCPSPNQLLTNTSPCLRVWTLVRI